MSRNDPLGETRVGTTLEQRPQSASNPNAPPCLVFIAGDKIGRKLEVRGEEIVFGRDPSCTVPLQSDLVSRQHAKVAMIFDQVQLVDLNSTNGTYVNDKQIRNVELRDGDRISMGDVVFKFLATGNVEANYHDVVYRLMSYDGLTEVLNKRVFSEHSNAAASDTSRPLSVIVFDADHFKQINDNHGHAAGDMVLRQLARTTETVLPEGCELARVGGEEFSVLARMGSADAVALGEHIRRAVEGDAFTWKDKRIPVTVSVGVASRAAGVDESSADLFQRADAALYRAKGSGRNRVCA